MQFIDGLGQGFGHHRSHCHVAILHQVLPTRVLFRPTCFGHHASETFVWQFEQMVSSCPKRAPKFMPRWQKNPNQIKSRLESPTTSSSKRSRNSEVSSKAQTLHFLVFTMRSLDHQKTSSWKIDSFIMSFLVKGGTFSSIRASESVPFFSTSYCHIEALTNSMSDSMLTNPASTCSCRKTDCADFTTA